MSNVKQPYVPRPGTGSILRNRNRQEGTRQPDYKGYVILDQDYVAGTKLQFGGWKKETRIGPVINLKISNRKDREDTPEPEAGDVPF